MSRLAFRLQSIPAASGSLVRIDTASGSNTPADLRTLGGNVIDGAIIRSGSNGGHLPTVLGPDGVTTLYQKVLDYRGQVTGSPVTLTGEDDNPSSGGAVQSGTYAPLEIINPTALKPWWYALGNRNTARVNVLAWGDSLTVGARALTYDATWFRVLQQQIMARYPCIGGNPAGGIYYPAWLTSTNAPALPITGTTAGNFAYYGPGFTNTRLTGGTHSQTYTVTGTSANVWFAKHTAASSVTVSIDGGTAATVNIPASGSGTTNLDGFLYNVTLGAAGSHTIAIVWVSGTVNVAGVDVFNGDETKGIHIVQGGHSGYAAQDYLVQEAVTGTPNPGASIQQVAATLNPDLLIVMLGVNDWGKSQQTAAQFTTSIQSVISKLRAGAPNAALLQVIEPFSAVQTGPVADTYDNFVAACYAMAAADPTRALLDLSARYPKPTDTATYGMFHTDNIHWTPKGHAFVADELSRALSPR